jgi:hypothetical protein
MLDWANAIGRPPEEGPLGPDAHGHIVFLEGPHVGQPVSRFPLHLAWLDKARVKLAGGWRWRYPESVRRWSRRWLEVRAAGRARQRVEAGASGPVDEQNAERRVGPSFGTGVSGSQPGKGFHVTDWALDPCIAVPRHRRGLGSVGAAGRAPGLADRTTQPSSMPEHGSPQPAGADRLVLDGASLLRPHPLYEPAR